VCAPFAERAETILEQRFMSRQHTSIATFDSASQAVPPQMHEALAVVERIGGLELIERVSSLFRSTSNERMEKVHDALAAGDATQIGRLAHALKGSSAQIGAEELRLVALSLEKEATSLDESSLACQVERLGRNVRLAWAQLERYHATRGLTR
jgi:HPt (histidine-containing phosphotransfer) domain-containing protein